MECCINRGSASNLESLDDKITDSNCQTVYSDDPSIKDEVQNVADLAERLLRILIYRMLEKLMHEEAADGDFNLSTIPPSILNELRVTRKHFMEDSIQGSDFDKCVIQEVVSCIERQADFVTKNFHKSFHQLALELDFSNGYKFAFDAFVNICKKFFEEGDVTWYRILSLICFSAEVALSVIKHGGPGLENFLKKIVHHIVEFIVKEEIAEWISTHGGWVSALENQQTVSCMPLFSWTLLFAAVDAIPLVSLRFAIQQYIVW